MRNKYAAFYTELNKLPGMSKEEAVYNFTNGRTRSLRDLSPWDLQELTRRMRTLTTKPLTVAKPPDDRRIPMIKKVVYLAHEMRMVKPLPEGNGSKNDYTALNKWMLEKSYLRKKLNAYTYGELPKLVSQFDAVYRSWLKSL